MEFGRGNKGNGRREIGVGNLSMDLFVFIAFVIMGLATIFLIAAMSTNHWVDTVSEQYGTVGYSGLWQTCTDFGMIRDSCRGFIWTDVQVSHWFRTVQSFIVLGFVSGTTALLLYSLHHFVSMCKEKTGLKAICILLLGLACLFIILACTMVGCLRDVQKAFEIKSTVHLSWGFGFGIVASLLYLASAIAVLIS